MKTIMVTLLKVKVAGSGLTRYEMNNERMRKEGEILRREKENKTKRE
jgi:hypothetical protein